MSEITKPGYEPETRPQCTAAARGGVAAGVGVGAEAAAGGGGGASLGAHVEEPAVASARVARPSEPVPGPAAASGAGRRTVPAPIPSPQGPEFRGATEALAVCRALDRPLTALSGLIEAAAADAHPSEELRALLERVGRQAAAVHALARIALAASVRSPEPTASGQPAATQASAVAAQASPPDANHRATLRNLTERENEILILVADGLASKEIAHRLGITSATVRSHVQNILTKLGVCNRRQAAALLTRRVASPARARHRAARQAPAAGYRQEPECDVAPPHQQPPAQPEQQPDQQPDPLPLATAADAASSYSDPPTIPSVRPGISLQAAVGDGLAAHTQQVSDTSADAALSCEDAPPGLTRREMQVLRCLAAGLGRAEIAERLYVSPHTARTHIQRVLAKLGVHSALGAMAVAREVGVAPLM